MTLPESQDQNTPVEEHDDDQPQAPEQSEILEVVERLKTSNQNEDCKNKFTKVLVPIEM